MLSLIVNDRTPRGGNEKADLRFRLARLLLCSEHMLGRAREGGWEEVEALERERRADLQDCFANALDVDDSDAVREAVAALMHINEQLVALVGQARREAQERRQDLDKGRRAAWIYRQGGKGV